MPESARFVRNDKRTPVGLFPTRAVFNRRMGALLRRIAASKTRFKIKSKRNKDSAGARILAALLRRPQHFGTYLPAESLARDPWRRRARRSRRRPRRRQKPRRVPPSLFRRKHYVRVPSSAAHLRKQVPQPAAAGNARARRVCITHAVKLFDALETRIGVSPRAHTQARGQGQEVARQAGVGQEEPQEVARRVWTLCYSHERVTGPRPRRRRRRRAPSPPRSHRRPPSRQPNRRRPPSPPRRPSATAASDMTT